MIAKPTQRRAPMPLEVLVRGFMPLPVRDRSIAEIVRRKLAKKHGTLAVEIRSRWQ